MYSRKRPSRILFNLLFGVLAVSVVTGAFFWFQQKSSGGETRLPALIIPTNTAAPTLPKATKVAVADQLRLFSEKVRLSAPIVETYYGLETNWNISTLGSNVGHLEGTNELGKGGNYVLAGHVEFKDGGIGPFAYLHQIKVGDALSIIRTGSKGVSVLPYTVTNVATVKPDDMSVLHDHGYEELTLITCSDWSEQERLYTTRLVVHARPTAKH